MPRICGSVSVLLIMVKSLQKHVHTQMQGGKWKRKGSALFKLVTQKWIIISTAGLIALGQRSGRILSPLSSSRSPLSLFTYSLAALPPPSTRWSDIRQYLAEKARDGEERRKDDNKVISSSSWHLHWPRFLLLPCQVICTFTLSFIFSLLFFFFLDCWLSQLYCSLICLSISFPLLSGFFLHPSFCLFAFLNLSFSLVSPSFGLIFLCCLIQLFLSHFYSFL